MKIDIDRPSTWLKYRNGLCNGCNSGCCQMPVEVQFEDLLRLGIVTEDDHLSSRKKLVARLTREKIIQSYRFATELFMLSQRSNRDCLYLHPQTRLCTVYEKRPGVCRQFPQIGPRPTFCPATRVSD